VGIGEAGGGCEPARARADATAQLRVYANDDPRRICTLEKKPEYLSPKSDSVPKMLDAGKGCVLMLLINNLN
jgi:hypothetical protein